MKVDTHNIMQFHLHNKKRFWLALQVALLVSSIYQLLIMDNNQTLSADRPSHRATTVLSPMFQSSNSVPQPHKIIGNNTNSTVVHHIATIQNNKITGSSSHISVVNSFPRWVEDIPITHIDAAVRITLDGKLKVNRAHRVYIVDQYAHLWRATVQRSAKLDDTPLRRGDRMEALLLDTLRTIRTIQTQPQNTTTGQANRYHNTFPSYTAITESNKYPHLMKAIQQGGFAFIANYADSMFCCNTSPFVDDKEKIVANLQVPIFTLSAPVQCQSTFPVPTYETIKHASQPWGQLIQQYHEMYNWTNKIQKAVWRGAPTGHWDAKMNTRYQLCNRTHSSLHPDLFDTKFTRTRHPRTTAQVGHWNESRFLASKMPMLYFQKYRAILDVDGHSWSSRFGALLCYSSVVLKVEPSHVDYFYTELQPWVHYIPVDSNLENLEERTIFAVSDDPHVQQIIRNANNWCLQKLNLKTLRHDMANIWDQYTSHISMNTKDPTSHTNNSSWQSIFEELLQEYEFEQLD